MTHTAHTMFDTNDWYEKRGFQRARDLDFCSGQLSLLGYRLTLE